jgi:hypothetical protein
MRVVKYGESCSAGFLLEVLGVGPAQRSEVRREAVALPFRQKGPVGAQDSRITSFSTIFFPVFPPFSPLNLKEQLKPRMDTDEHR